MDELQAELTRLRAENERLKSTPKGGDKPLTMKIGAKKGLSIYGLGRFPVTLYKEQWERLLGIADEIRSYIKANERALKGKED
jgi:hypothetical protein